MKFACEGCGKRYATAQEPAPGRVYRITCTACGHLVVVVGPDAPAEPSVPAGAGLEAISIVDGDSPPADLPRPVAAPAAAGPPVADSFGDLFADVPQTGERSLRADAAVSAPPPRPGTPPPRTVQVPEIPPHPAPRPRTTPLVLIGAGVLALLAILAFVLLGGKRVPEPRPSPPSQSSPREPVPTGATVSGRG